MSATLEVTIGLVVAVNSAVPVVAILRRRQLRESTMYRLLASMASAQALVGVTSALLGTLKLLQMSPPDWACATLLFLRSAVGASTVVALLALSLERYVTVVHGLRYFDIITDRQRRLLLAASWLVAALLWIFGMALHRAFGADDDGVCDHWESIPPTFRITISLFVLTTYLPCLCINVFVAFVAWRKQAYVW
ncbi:melanocyte-stimulating hormone receptor-like [Pollicipes pollicipes]|uniref:melanocyte-stimulating hormone receptor-like n=1 Tax=Pollicipes pollicipes TaxID=41117 RepID=UPI001885A065|nr:melanocyte-stimulating hormone receptor-like [Pollicipes pollicipes]